MNERRVKSALRRLEEIVRGKTIHGGLGRLEDYAKDLGEDVFKKSTCIVMEGMGGRIFSFNCRSS